MAIVDAVETADRIGVSPVLCFELAPTYKKGRSTLPLPPADWFPLALHGSGAELLPLDDAIAVCAVEPSEIHRDPSGRIIIATALQSNSKLASAPMAISALIRNWPKYYRDDYFSPRHFFGFAPFDSRNQCLH
uniref:Uncharacterized protein n=1 Tax=Candidatus Kentrum sp. FW TaxID=2126338 RepID=A0A450TKF0_9GAMM|nr:MAG: hypothetical protein BECKFW1821C_GA0114237_101343 [Candidatus Kentron sp. FW]